MPLKNVTATQKNVTTTQKNDFGKVFNAVFHVTNKL